MRLCETCRFWFQGECRRYPPEVTPSGTIRFPLVPKDAWCGEHQGKPGRKAKE